MRLLEVERERERARKELEIEEKSRLGHTSHTSGVKRSEDFQSPEVGSRTYGYKSPHTENQGGREEESHESHLSARVESKKNIRSGGKIERKYEETE